MYSEDDLDSAITHNILNKDDVSAFRNFIASQRNTAIADEEFVKFVSGFNDIFVVIACVLALASSTYIIFDINDVLGGLCLMVMSWLMSEYFTAKRRLALPSIMLVFSFVMGCLLFISSLLSDDFFEHHELIGTALIGSFASFMAFIHWKRFAVPITFATILATFCYSIILGLILLEKDYNYNFIAAGVALILGLFVLFLAMKWDMADKQRRTSQSDVAFWLHLTSAPMIVHAIFSLLNIVGSGGSLFEALCVLCVFLILSIVSLSIDRRALMVSSLFYVLYIFTQLFDKNGISESFAITAMILGFALVVLSAFWHNIRHFLVSKYPSSIQAMLPNIHVT